MQWHPRLDQDIDNLFQANEYVGYEDDDGRFIFVMIVYAVSPIIGAASLYSRK